MTELAVVSRTPLADIPDKKAFIQDVLARYEQGELMAEIASGIGLKAADQIYRLLVAEAPEQWKSYQAAKSLRRLEDATVALHSASDALGLARAREEIRAAQWELEKLLRRLYGQEAALSTVVPIQIIIGIRREDATNAVQHDLPDGDDSKEAA